MPKLLLIISILLFIFLFDLITSVFQLRVFRRVSERIKPLLFDVQVKHIFFGIGLFIIIRGQYKRREIAIKTLWTSSEGGGYSDFFITPHTVSKINLPFWKNVQVTDNTYIVKKNRIRYRLCGSLLYKTETEFIAVFEELIKAAEIVEAHPERIKT